MNAPDLSKLKIDRSATPQLKRRRRIPVWPFVLAAALALAGWSYWQRASVFEVETVTVTTAYPSQALTLLNATGYVVAQRKAAVASKATGRLEWLGVTEGSRVKKDEVIARLENLDVQANMEQAAASIRAAQANLGQGRAELREAEVTYRRSRELVSKGFISRSAMDTALARYDKAKAVVRNLRAAIAVAQAAHRSSQVAVEQTLIRAPFDGVVLSKSANVGDIVTPFSSAVDSKGAVANLADMATLEVEADVAESSLQKIRVDQPCEVQLDAFPDERFEAAVSRMVPTIDRSKATLQVKVRFAQLDARILPDMSAKVAFLDKPVPAEMRKPVTATNPRAIVTRGGRNVAYVIEGEQVREVQVTKGDALGDMVQVSGIKPGDKIVLNPSDKLRSGARVRLAQK